MKIKDLIEKFNKFDKNKQVFVWTCGCLFELESVAERTAVDEEDESNGEAVIYLKELE